MFYPSCLALHQKTKPLALGAAILNQVFAPPKTAMVIIFGTKGQVLLCKVATDCQSCWWGGIQIIETDPLAFMSCVCVERCNTNTTTTIGAEESSSILSYQMLTEDETKIVPRSTQILTRKTNISSSCSTISLIPLDECYTNRNINISQTTILV